MPVSYTHLDVYKRQYMDSVPASAACNEAVKLAERKGFRNLKGFVNGVLRNISRNLEKIEYPDEKKYPYEAISVRTSVPVWMLKQWSKDYGLNKAKTIAESFQTKKGTAIRINLTKTCLLYTSRCV